jgi:hypothetical protein
MALSEDEKKKIEEEKYREQVAVKTPQVQLKHGIPALLSFFIPGLG